MTVERIHAYGLLRATKAQLQRLIRDVEEREEELKTAAASMGGRGDGMPHVRAGHPDAKLVNAVDALDKARAEHRELIELYMSTIAKIDAEQLEIERAMATLPYAEACVARARYMEDMTIDEICRTLPYSRSSVYRLLDRARELLERA